MHSCQAQMAQKKPGSCLPWSRAVAALSLAVEVSAAAQHVWQRLSCRDHHGRFDVRVQQHICWRN